MDREESVEFARKLVEDIVSFFGENIAVEAHAEGEIISLAVESSDLNSILIGRGAETLRSLQYIVSMALHSQGAALTHAVVDVANYKKQREDKIAAGLKKSAERAIRTWRASTPPTAASFTASLPNTAIFALTPRARGASVILSLRKPARSDIIISRIKKGYES